MDHDAFLKLVKSSTQQTCFYHFTDKRNLALIKEHGLLSMSLIKSQKLTIPAPGGNQWSHDADLISGMDKYVHLCFKTGHPMEHSAVQDGRIVELVYLQIDPCIIKLPGVLITDDVSNKSGVNSGEPTEMLDKIDLDVLYKRMRWADPVVNSRLKAAEKCEILVPDLVSIQYILNI